MSKETYDHAFEILSAKKKFESSLDYIGLNFEYGNGPIGEFMESLLNHVEPIIKNELGLVIEEIEKAPDIIIGCNTYPVDVYVNYTVEHDKDWCITDDDFCEFFYKAIDDENLRELMWKVMADRDEDAKAKFNKAMKGNGIGTWRAAV